MEKANSQGEFVFRLCIKGLVIGCPASEMVFGIISLIFCFLKYGTIDTNHLYLPYKLR